MPKKDIVKTVTRKAPIVMNSAKILNTKLENGEITNDEAYAEMIRFVNSGNFIDYWIGIDDLLKQKYESENWFWLVRRVRNTIND